MVLLVRGPAQSREKWQLPWRSLRPDETLDDEAAKLARKTLDTTPALIEQIRPDVLVKGADYKKEQVVGWDVVESYGGKVALAPLVDGRSTSAVIQRILEAYS